jgi:hypothetical protein
MMTTRKNEARNDVLQLAASAGASCRIGQTRGGHPVAIIGFNGRVQKVFFSTTSTGWHARNNLRGNVRKALRALGVFTVANENNGQHT